MSLNTPEMKITQERCVLSGDWVVAAFKNKSHYTALKKELEQACSQSLSWDLQAVRLDHVMAEVIWLAWGQQLPARTSLTDDQKELFARLGHYQPEPNEVFGEVEKKGFFEGVGLFVFSAIEHMGAFTRLVGEFFLDCFKTLKNPAKAPWKEFSGQVLRMGAHALPVTGLVGLLIGVVIVYLMSSFLKSYGLEIYIINMIGIVSIRELGPLLAAILVAGRSGSTITAQIGVMRLREELDAMHVLGISANYRLVFPRVLALALVMPFISLWTSLLAILGGMLIAGYSIGITNSYFMEVLPTTVHIGNLWMALGKSVVFGALIALIGCHYGLRVRSDTESLGNGTTASVVASITGVILADAVFAILCRTVPVMP